MINSNHGKTIYFTEQSKYKIPLKKQLNCSIH